MDLRKQGEECLARFRAGTLTEGDLQAIVDALGRPPKQSLLYIQAENTNPGSTPLGMLMIVDGKCIEPPPDAKDWPYKSVLDAMQDGWRVISFPDLALLMDPVVPKGLGCEFILEKWG